MFFLLQSLGCSTAWGWLLVFTKDLLQIKIKCKVGKTASSHMTPIRSFMLEKI